jgi:hypothetical protein
MSYLQLFHFSRNRSLLLRQWSDSEVGFDRLELRKKLLGLVVCHARVDNDIVTRHLVDGSSDSVLVASLQRVHDSQNLRRVSADRRRVGEDGSDCLLGVHDENRKDGESDSFRIHTGGVLMIKHVIERGDLSLLVANDGKFQIGTPDLVDILDPASVTLNGIGRQTNEFDASFRELWFEFGKCSKFGGVDRSVVLGVGEQDHPVVSNELVKVDGTSSGFGLEIGSNGAQ